MTETAVFVALSACFAVLLWFARPAAGEQRWLALPRTALLLALPLSAFVFAYLNHNGAQLTVRLTQMRVPQSIVAAAATPDFADFLSVGDRPESADLVVSPYADQSLSRISMPAEPRTFVKVRARPAAPGAQPDTPMDASLELQSFAALPEVDMPGMGVVVDGERIAPGDPVSRTLEPDQPVAITIERIDADGYADRRSFSVVLKTGAKPAIELTLNQSLSAAAGSCSTPRLRLSPMTSSDAREPLFRDPENLTFSALGQPRGNAVVEPRWLGPLAEPAFLCAKSETHFTWPASVDANEARLKLVSRKIYLPWYTCIFALFCIVAMHGICAPGWRVPGAERVAIPLLQWLLCLRLLIGVAGLYNDTGLAAREILSDGMASLLCLPVLAVASLRPGGREVRTLMASLAVVVAAGLIAMHLSLGGIALFGIPALLCGFTVAAVLARAWKPEGDAPLTRATTLFAGLIGEAAADPDKPKRGRKAAAAGPESFLFGLPHKVVIGAGIVLAMIVIRFVLAVIGNLTGLGLTERIFGLPLSMLYVPAVPLGFALLLDGLRPLPRQRLDLIAVFILFVGAYWFIPFITRDFGLIFVSGWPLAMVIGWYGARYLVTPGSRLWRTGWWLAPALPVLFIAAWGVYIALFSEIASPTTALGSHMAEVVGWSRNDVRMLAFLAPDRIEALGTKFAFESLDLITSLQPLTQDLIGQGYLTPSNVRRSPLDNQFSDNLSAVHIIWPWGRAGAVALLLVIVTGIRSFRPVPVAGDEESAPGWRTLAGIMAGVTFAWAAIYMVMANLNWVPFTGRNVYLLAATSGGDLVEGLLLILMMGLPLALALPKAEAR